MDWYFRTWMLFMEWTSMTDRLMVEQIKKLLGSHEYLHIYNEPQQINVDTLLKQLLDTMRENERLKKELHAYRMTFNPMGKDIITGFQLSNKESTDGK